MYNDLGITKEDIRHWTREAVKEVALEFVNGHIDDWELSRTIRNQLDSAVRSAISHGGLLKEIFIENIEIVKKEK